MAEYVVVDKEQLESDLTIVADSIRAKSGTTEDLPFPLGMKEVVESIDTSKEEQEKTISITEKGTTEVIPDTGKVLSKVTVNVEVESGGGSDEEFVGIKYSDFTGVRGMPKVGDASSLPLDSYAGSTFGGYPNLFSASTKNANGGWNHALETVYLPNGLTELYTAMFMNCANLKKVHDTELVTKVSNNCFQNCISLVEFPYMPNVTNINNNAFNGCTGLTELPDMLELTTIKNSAFEGCTGVTKMPYMPKLVEINSYAFSKTGITSVYIYNTLTTIFHPNAFSNTNVTDIYVPWSEGEVSNAPWGATNATIHYNTTYDENHNPIV